MAVALTVAAAAFPAAGFTLAGADARAPAPELQAKSWLLVDYDSGQALAARNAESVLPPASLTKLAVAYVLFQRLRNGTSKLADSVTVSAHAAEAKGTRLFLRAGDTVTVEDLIKGMLVVSANDAAVALGEYAAGNESAFVAQMNAAAHTLGLAHTTFANPTGLPAAGHVSTARDLARLATALLREFPEYYPWFSIKEVVYRGIHHYNRNALLWRDPSVDGIKTGQTREAGFCLIASAKRGDMRLIAAVLGGSNDNVRVLSTQQLLDFGFRYYETRLLYPARSAVTSVRVWMGDSSVLPLGLTQSLYLTLPRGWHDRLRARLTVKQDQTAPVHAGQTVGELDLDLDNAPIAQYPLVALEDVGKGNIFRRAYDHMRLWMQ